MNISVRLWTSLLGRLSFRKMSQFRVLQEEGEQLRRLFRRLFNFNFYLQSKIYCDCKTRKVDATCDKIRSGFRLNCDDTCKVRLEEMRLATEEQERKQREIEEEKNRLEMLEFEKKFGKKKFKERKRNVVEETENKMWIVWVGVAIVLAAVGVVGFYIFT